MKIHTNNPCFVCGFRQSELLFKKSYPMYGYPGLFYMRRCSDCGLIFNSPRLPDEALSNLYGEGYYFFDRDDEQEFHRVTQIYLRTLALIRDQVGHRQVLEVGSAKGYLLALLRKLGWEVQGVEISTFASQYAREELGVTSFAGTIEDFAELKQDVRWPVVLAIDVIEHVLRPSVFLDSIDKLIQDGGFLIIDTPNANARNILVKRMFWSGFNPFHIFLFSVSNLTRLLEDRGYVIERVFSYGNTSENRFYVLGQRMVACVKSLLRSILYRLNLLNKVMAMKSKARKFCKSSDVHKDPVWEMVSRSMKSSPIYVESEDSRAELSKGCRGDNIVIIAKKQTEK